MHKHIVGVIYPSRSLCVDDYLIADLHHFLESKAIQFVGRNASCTSISSVCCQHIPKISLVYRHHIATTMCPLHDHHMTIISLLYERIYSIYIYIYTHKCRYSSFNKLDAPSVGCPASGFRTFSSGLFWAVLYSYFAIFHSLNMIEAPVRDGGMASLPVMVLNSMKKYWMNPSICFNNRYVLPISRGAKHPHLQF